MSWRTVFRQAFFYTIPVMMGYLVLGTAFGLVMSRINVSWLWAVAMSIFVFAGSLQFVLASLIASQASLASIAIATLAVNSRHIFYGLSFIDTFKAMTWRRPYMIFSLTDETYALFCALPNVPLDQNQKHKMFAISALDQSYWVAGTIIGSLLGHMVPIDFTGVDFAMTALFTVITIDQWREHKNRIPAITGGLCAVASLILLGADRFLLPALVASVLILSCTMKRVKP